MSTIKSNGSSGDCPASSTADDDFKFIVHSLRVTLSASDRFLKFIQLSSSHESVMADNLTTIKSILLEIILKLLSSFKFKFTSLITYNGRKPGFTEMLNQMDKFCMHDHHHWSLIIEETRQSLDKFSTVNKAKYEDLIQFTHLTLDHITKQNIRLDLQSFAILFNIMSSSQLPDCMDLAPLPCSLLNFTPLKILPTRRLNQVRVIKATNCKTPPPSPVTVHSKFSLSTHRRRLNFDALDEEENGTGGDSNSTPTVQSSHSNESENPVYQLIPFPLRQFKIYQRPEGYSYQPHKLKSPLEIPLELKVSHLPDPRTDNRVVIVHKVNHKRPIRMLHANGTITVNLMVETNDTNDGLDADTVNINIVDDDQSKPVKKRKRIVWDLD